MQHRKVLILAYYKNMTKPTVLVTGADAYTIHYNRIIHIHTPQSQKHHFVVQFNLAYGSACTLHVIQYKIICNQNNKEFTLWRNNPELVF